MWALQILNRVTGPRMSYWAEPQIFAVNTALMYHNKAVVD